MELEDIDFTPEWYCHKDNENHIIGKSVPVLSKDECRYLHSTWESFMGPNNHWGQSNPIHNQYADRLGVYYERFGVQMPAKLRRVFLLRAKKLITYKERFGNDMPVEIRKELLRGLE